LARRQIGDLKGAVQALDKAVEGTRRPAVRIDLLLTQAEILERDAGHFEQALALLDEVETAIPDLPPNDRAAPRRRVLTTRSGIHYWQGDYPRGEALAREALELAEDRDGLSQARQVLAINLQRLGRQSEAISLYQAILADLETRDNRRRQAQGYINLGNGLQAVGRLQEALEAFERAREIAGLLGNRRVLSVVATNLGSLSALIRPLREAESEQRLAIELAEEVGARYTAAHARYHLGMVLALQGHWRQAQEAIDESIRFAEEIAARVMIAQAHLVWGLYLAWPRGDWTESERRGRLALEIGEEQGDNFCRREARLLLGRLSLRAGDPERALAWAQEAHELATRAEQRISIGRAERLLGQIAAVAGLLEDAEAHFHAALEIFEGCAAGLERGRTLLARARAWRSWGEAHDRSQADVESAAGLFRKSGAAPLLAEALSFLRDESDDDR
jgi:tetratricopeptide (TPR) repeat protein